MSEPEPKHVRMYFPPQAFHIVGNPDGKTDGDRIREAYGSQLRQTNKPTKTVVAVSGNPSNMKMVFEQNANGQWEVEFQGLRAYIEELIKSSVTDVVERLEKLESGFGNAFRMTEDILKKSWHPANKQVQDMIIETVRDRFGVKEKPKRRTQESLYEAGEPTQQISLSSKSFQDNPEWSPKERKEAEKAYFRDLIEHGVEEE